MPETRVGHAPPPPRNPPLATENVGTYRLRRRSRFGGPALLLMAIPTFTFGLGIWQLRRLKWKLALIDEIDDKLAREPMELPPRIKCASELRHRTRASG